MENYFKCNFNIGGLVVIKIISPTIRENYRFIVEINPDKTLKLFPNGIYAKIHPDYCLIDVNLTEHYQRYCHNGEISVPAKFREAINNLEIYSGLERVFCKPVYQICQVIF
jgi:hypothetical protein